MVHVHRCSTVGLKGDLGYHNEPEIGKIHKQKRGASIEIYIDEKNGIQPHMIFCKSIECEAWAHGQSKVLHVLHIVANHW